MRSMRLVRQGAAAIAAAVAAGACVTNTPPAPPPAPQDAYVRAPFDSVWTAVVSYFADTRVPIGTIDKTSGLIASRAFTLPDDAVRAWANCGTTSSGESAVERLYSINNPPRLSADFNVFVQPRGDSTAVRVNLGLTGQARSPGGMVALTCVTNGKFEEGLIAHVRARAGRP